MSGKYLAKALIAAGVPKYGLGGFVSNVTRPVGDVLGGLTGGLYQGLGINNSYQAQAPGITQQQFIPQIQGMQTREQEIYQQQQALAQALLAQSQGMGPNPALAQLNQTTGQNIQGQAALMAGQRGASANPALMARLAAQQGAGIQQNAVGQAAVIGAQQQLAAQQALQQQQQAMSENALQNQQVYQQGLANQNTALTTGQNQASQINAQTAAGNQQARSQLIGSMINAGGKAATMGGGGGAPGMAQGGEIFTDDGHVPGVAEVEGDSEENDIVPAVLSPGEVVIPRSVMNSKDPVKGAADFVRQLLKDKGEDGDNDKASEFLRHLKPQKKGYGGIIESRKGKGKC